MLRYWVTILACLVVAGIALRQERPAPPGVPSPVELIGSTGDPGESRARLIRRGDSRRARQRPRRKSEDGRAAARRRRDRQVPSGVARGSGLDVRAPAVRAAAGTAVVAGREADPDEAVPLAVGDRSAAAGDEGSERSTADDDDGDDAAGEGRSAARAADD